MRKLVVSLFVLCILGLIAAGALLYWVQDNLKPGPLAKETLVRYDNQTPLSTVLDEMEAKGVVRNATALGLYARYKKDQDPIAVGTYKLKPGLSGPEVLKALRDPIRQMVRLPETNWSKRSASILEKNQVCTAAEYLALVAKPEEFEEVVSFPLPEDSLEGYLYPDTYDLPPLLGAKATIVRQLRAFEDKVWKGLDQPEDLHRLVTIASMVQMEVMKDEERKKVAGVIENRLRIRMPLQIDATINYALQEWRPLSVAEYRSVKSPYNTYLTNGLPPGPICSPSVRSIEAALKPESHGYLYYVADPVTNYHMFAATYGEHLQNVAKRRRLARESKS